YLVEKLGIEENKVSDLCNLLYKNYGTTMAGLKVFTNADKVHAAKVLKKLRLEDCFEGIICFETLNPPSSSSVTETSSQIFDIVEHFARPDTGGIELPKTPILCKPSLEAMEYALRIANIDPQRTVRRIYVRSRRSSNSVADTIHFFYDALQVFFDDSVRNIQSGKRIGLHTVLVGTPHRVKGADYALESIHNIREALPELWEEAEKSDGIRYSGKVAMETPVTA
ncbi:hypothetical protein GW17_00000688, partial [Ensete ventricosum]